MAKHVKALNAMAILAGLGFAFAAVRVGKARGGLTQLMLWMPPDIDPSERARHMADAASRLLVTVQVASQVFGGAALLGCLVLVFTGTPSVARRLTAVGSLLFALSAAAAWASNRELFVGGHSCGAPCLYQTLLGAQRWQMLGKLAVLASAALGWVLLVARAYADAKRTQGASRRTVQVSTLLLLIGSTAFAATRSHAWDTQHPMAPDAPNANTHACLPDEAHLAALPAARPDCEAAEGPLIELTAQGIMLDGHVVPDPAQLEHDLKAKREIWRQLGMEGPFSTLLLVAAPRSATTQQLLPWLAAAERAGFPNLGIYLQAPPLRLASATVGTVTKLRCCSTVWQLDASTTTALTSWQTWGELSAVTSGPERKLALR